MTLAFTVYFGLMATMMGLSMAATGGRGTNGSVQRRNGLIVAAASITAFTLLIGFRYFVGGDYETYVDYFDITREDTELGDVPFEFGFYLLIKLLKMLDLPVQSFFIVTTFAQIALLFFWLRNNPYLSTWALYFYFTTLMVFLSMSLIRQMTAFAILLCVVPYIRQHRPVRYMVGVAVATLLHTSAAIFAPLYFVAGRKWVKGVWAPAVAIGLSYAFAPLIAEQVFNNLSKFTAIFYDNYSNVQQDLFFEGQDNSYGIALPLTFLVDIFVVLYSKRLEKHYERAGFTTYFNLFLVSAIAVPVVHASNYIPFSRLLLYFSGFRFVVLAFLSHYLFSVRRDPNSRILGTILTLVFMAWFVSAIFKGAAWCSPFQFAP